MEGGDLRAAGANRPRRHSTIASLFLALTYYLYPDSRSDLPCATLDNRSIPSFEYLLAVFSDQPLLASLRRCSATTYRGWHRYLGCIKSLQTDDRTDNTTLSLPVDAMSSGNMKMALPTAAAAYDSAIESLRETEYPMLQGSYIYQPS